MWFLWLQILFLLLLAAVCGAGLMYWWLKGRFEEVTEITSTESHAEFAKLMPREDLEKELRNLAAKVDGLEKTDLGPVHSRLDDLSGKLAGQSQNFGPLLTEIQGLGNDIQNSGTDTSGLETRLDAIEAAVRDVPDSLGEFRQQMDKTEAFDTAPLLERLARIETDLQSLAPISSEFAKLNQRSTQFEGNFAESLKAAIGRLDQKVSDHKGPDLRPLQQELRQIRDRLPELESALQPVAGNIKALETHVAATVQGGSETRDTVSALTQRLAKMENDLGLLSNRGDVAGLKPSIDQLESSIAHLREMVFNLRDRDVSALNSAVRAIEARVDFVGVENRLTSIEYGLAATHHMLRSRLEQGSTLPPQPQRAPFNGPPPQGMTASFDMPATKPLDPKDPVDILRVSNAPGNLLLEAGFGRGDDLEQIKGIGPMLRQLLNDIGVFYYWQIANWSETDVNYVDEKLPGYYGRITRDDWVAQAKVLANLPDSAKRPQPFGQEG